MSRIQSRSYKHSPICLVPSLGGQQLRTIEFGAQRLNGCKGHSCFGLAVNHGVLRVPLLITHVLSDQSAIDRPVGSWVAPVAPVGGGGSLPRLSLRSPRAPLVNTGQ